MVWDVKALPDCYELVREDTRELLLGFFSQRLPLDLNLGIFSVCPQKQNKTNKPTTRKASSLPTLGIIVFGYASFRLSHLQ